MKKFLFILILILSFSLFLVFFYKSRLKMIEIKKINFITSDGVKIFANYYPNKEAKFAGILIHMRPKTKESFDDFAKFLQKKGFSLLALDLRGHGESIESTGGILDYTKFTEDEEKESIKDIEAASNFLEKEGFSKERQFLIGASIGANLAYQFLTENESIKAVVLLSPGYNYRGLILDNFYKKDLDSRILVISSKDDQEMALKGFEWFKEKHPSANFIMLEKGGHGTNYFDIYPQIKETIYNFLLEKLSF